VASFVLGAVITYGGTAVMSLSAGQLVERFLSGWSVGPMLMSSGVFGLLISVQSWSERWRRFLAWLSQASFCIYLVHVFFLYLLRHFGITASAGLPILSIPAITLVIIALSVLVYEVLRRVPIVKTYLI
jgi:surface polysaccharide O-acyltransferase-like enzyme